MATIGIQTDRYGKLVFDEAAFDEAYAADPAAVAAQFTTGTPTGPRRLGRPVQTVANDRERLRTGTLTTAITGRRPASTGSATTSTPGTTGWRCAATSLTRQFTALETALSSHEEPGQLARRPDRLTPLLLVVTTEGTR